MKKLLFLILIAFIAKQSNGQLHGQDKIDSLISILKTKDDTARVNTLNVLCYELRNLNPDTAAFLGNEALALATKLHYEIGIANAKLGVGRAIANLGKTNEALKYGNEALLIYDKLLASEDVEAKRKDIVAQKSNAFNMMGIVYMMKGNNPEALKHLFDALKIREEIGDELGISYTENNLGIIYFNQNNFDESLKHLMASLKIRIKLDDKSGASASYNNIGIIYLKKGFYTESLKNHTQSLKLAEEIKDNDAIGSAYNNIGEVFDKQGDFNEALKYHFEALKLQEKIGNKISIAVTFESIGEIFIKQKKYSEASHYLGASLDIAKEIESIDQLKATYYGLALLDSAQGNYKKAFENYKLYVIFRDSLVNNENIKRITEQQMQYDFDKKESTARAVQERKDAIAVKELQKQKLVRNGFIGGFTVVLLFAGIFFTQRNKIKIGKQRSDELLLNILPSEVAEELKAKGSADAKQFDKVTVMFTDFKGFTLISEKLSPAELVAEIHTCFKAFDNIIGKHNIEKIKTIGDSYMCAGGLPVANTTNATDVVNAAMEIQLFMQEHLQQRRDVGKEPFEIRIGIHTGPVVAGIVGVKKFAYDIWGDTVNIASRMESSGEAGKVNISGSTYELVRNKFTCTHRGKIEAKNKGEIDMYFVESVL